MLNSVLVNFSGNPRQVAKRSVAESTS
jgi:hypothetical protein